MAKLYSVGAKRRAKQFIHELASAPRAKKRGSARMKQMEPENTSVALEARARHMGKSARQADEMRAQMLGEQPGKALHLSCQPDEAAILWTLYASMTNAEGRYHRSMGMSIHAKTAKIEYQIDRFETRADDVPDLRTQDEKDRDAKRAWFAWDQRLSKLGIGHRSAIDTARMEFTPLVDIGAVTPAGKRFVAAMRRLADCS